MEADFRRFIELLPDSPGALVRHDKKFKELGLSAADYETPDAVVALLLEHPALMQRPIAVKGKRAVIGRPSEKIEALV